MGAGKILREMEYNDDPAIFSDMADTPDTAVFLATDADKARLIRPYLMVRPEAPVSIVSSEPVTDATTVLAPKQPAAKNCLFTPRHAYLWATTIRLPTLI